MPPMLVLAVQVQLMVQHCSVYWGLVHQTLLGYMFGPNVEGFPACVTALTRFCIAGDSRAKSNRCSRGTLNLTQSWNSANSHLEPLLWKMERVWETWTWQIYCQDLISYEPRTKHTKTTLSRRGTFLHNTCQNHGKR